MKFGTVLKIKCAKCGKEFEYKVNRNGRPRTICFSCDGPQRHFCLYCGKELDLYMAGRREMKVRQYRKQFCNGWCSAMYASYGPKKQAMIKTCPTCGKSFETWRKSRVYCSQFCAVRKRAFRKEVKKHD